VAKDSDVVLFLSKRHHETLLCRTYLLLYPTLEIPWSPLRLKPTNAYHAQKVKKQKQVGFSSTSLSFVVHHVRPWMFHQEKLADEDSGKGDEACCVTK
jgi:hypothetical protein